MDKKLFLDVTAITAVAAGGIIPLVIISKKCKEKLRKEEEAEKANLEAEKAKLEAEKKAKELELEANEQLYNTMKVSFDVIDVKSMVNSTLLNKSLKPEEALEMYGHFMGKYNDIQKMKMNIVFDKYRNRKAIEEFVEKVLDFANECVVFDSESEVQQAFANRLIKEKEERKLGYEQRIEHERALALKSCKEKELKEAEQIKAEAQKAEINKEIKLAEIAAETEKEIKKLEVRKQERIAETAAATTAAAAKLLSKNNKDKDDGD